MPPKLGLAIQISNDDAADQPALAESWHVKPSGGFALKSLQFTADGVSRAKDSISYKVNEADLKFVSTLGTGASSVVHKALHMRDAIGRRQEQVFVAVKKINVSAKELRSQMHNDVKFLIDAQAGQAEAEYDGLIRFEGAYHSCTSGQIAIVLEYMNGGSLADVLQSVKRIPENVLSYITFKVLKGLYYLHKRMHMVHRDIKPANILLNMDGAAKITDFGISKSIEHTQGFCNTFLGTVTYMSPERIESKPYGFPSDIWSLGLCLLECATGKYPYNANGGPLELMIQIMQEDAPIPGEGNCSRELRDFVRKCLDRDPNRRASVLDLLSHPFTLKHRTDPPDMPAFMKSAVDPQSQLDEISFFFVHNYYTLLTHALNARGGLEGLCTLYSASSVYTHQDVCVVGREAVTQSLQGVLQMMKGWGVHSIDVDTVDATALPNGPAVALNVQGQVRGGPGGPAHFAEMFVLNVAANGDYYVGNQAFRLLPQ